LRSGRSGWNGFGLFNAIPLRHCARKIEFATGRQDERALNNVLQFANVSRPGIRFQRPLILIRELLKAAPHALREAPAEGFREEENIISTFSQSRKPNGKDVQR
jgi:hypothetical protein